MTRRHNERAIKRISAKSWLRQRLLLEEQPVVGLRAMADRDGVAWSRVYEAKKSLRVKHRRVGWGPGSHMFWRMP